MARRTLEEIQESILLKKSQLDSLGALEVLTTREKQTLAGLNSGSKVSIWRLWVYIQAFAVWVHEGIFEAHKMEIEELIAANKLHTAKWYRGKTLDFQLGFDLGESDVYDNAGVEQSEVLASQIVKQASVDELAGTLKIKAAKDDGSGNLEALEPEQLTALFAYLKLVRDAGTRIEVISRPPDALAANFDIYFNPLILDAQGARLDGANDRPIYDAIEAFLYNLEFNGEFILTKLTDALQAVEGVEMPVILSASAKYGANPFVDLGETYIADSGYMKLNEELTNLNFIARELF
jgi:hypothetical protein